ncbi:hypothetical protein IWW38_000029 [Coemansia aciculifera]|uniref:Uncharacterized protein n=1 Tax=Coemansia aciculifera TaxID=417176 RepID=A0ACC1MAU2_9FUNG|nr:hypothetical protein IWW38_000029 [Coemansia aciculifera]
MDSADSPEDIAKKRLASLDTSSSINLSFERSLSPGDLKLLSLSSARLGTFIPDPSMGKQAITMHQNQPFSSTNPQLPTIQEIHGSSDSACQQQHHVPLATEADADNRAAMNVSFADSFSTNSDSMTTADMVFGQNSTSTMRAAALDLELQAAVDLMLQGSSSPPLNGPGFGAYYDGDRVVVPPPRALGASIPPPLASSSNSAHNRRGPYQSAMHSTRNMRQKLSSRFGRQRFASTASSTADDFGNGNGGGMQSDMPLLGGREEAAAKRKFGASGDDEACEKRARTADNGGEPQSRPLEPAATPPSWVPKFLYPVMYYVQLRPLRALGILLSILALILVLLFVVLVVGVFPLLLRSTLHDFSMVVTSLHAIPPPEIRRALNVEGRALSRTRLMALHDDGSSLVKRELLAPMPGEGTAGFKAPAQLPLQSLLRALPPQQPLLNAQSQAAVVPRSSAIQNAFSVSRALVPSSGAPRPGIAAMSPISSHQQLPWSSIGIVSNINDQNGDDIVTITAESVSIVHIQRELVATATPIATATPFAAPPTAAAPVLISSGDFKALNTDDTPASSTYMMQLAGNMTSGGPLGIDIEFTEPLRLMWHDTVVGIIHYPERIHVPGRGVAQWEWPPFEVTIPANGTTTNSRALVGGGQLAHNLNKQSPASQTLIQLGADRIVDSGAGGGIAQRRAMGGGSSAMLGRTTADPAVSGDLAGWFAAIQAHKSFTMQWKSKVKLSAIGLHASNIKFEKSVRVICGETKNCTIIETMKI